ncbi:MAG TPA: phosphonate ABC transporter, permease protein PhnE [Paracoccus sp. (in: a-proteobacteria)]|uniref:phosphonate ABC transporter, permease protein PhnE n=1 Tax=Paracoccus sp. TaxID=267 RepID=UPI002C900EF7|nr:phosphonate ABC transporter, permease protein PhnE [Paracoccus sp. (in: a-proteobacteria)]HWL55210.1 phosphonate ABC transporter, permease protein PhnE [Paracoccus sp. (in: a-proteobacteria)]
MSANAPPASLASFQRAFDLHRRRQRRQFWITALLLLAALALTAKLANFFQVTQVTLPDGSRGERWLLGAGLPRLGDYVEKTIPQLGLSTLPQDLQHWFWRWQIWAELLLETVLIAFMATVLGVAGGFILSFPAARNLAPSGWVRWLTRRYLEIARTVPEIVFALIFVFCFGIGPLAGVMAIALHSTGSLGKLYSEANENIDMRPVEGVRAAGGTWFDQIRYGVVPQVLPNTLSYTLLRFEINVRSSSIIGYVGAGGLGEELRTAVSLQEYTDLSALFLIILATVFLIDWASEKLRHRIIGLEAI